MKATLDNNYMAFSASPELHAIVEVMTGELDYSHQASGPFRPQGSLAAGATREFTSPVVVHAWEPTEFEIDYPAPPGTGATPPLPDGVELAAEPEEQE
ncbi:MAG: hypothetical protein L3J91_01025 [Thermoplasmata archaeon]|nr:hypothetical protein [Thermoplasmata archaeon]